MQRCVILKHDQGSPGGDRRKSIKTHSLYASVGCDQAELKSDDMLQQGCHKIRSLDGRADKVSVVTRNFNPNQLRPRTSGLAMARLLKTGGVRLDDQVISRALPRKEVAVGRRLALGAKVTSGAERIPQSG